MNWQSHLDRRLHCDDPAPFRRTMSDGHITPEPTGFLASVYQHPLLWGAAIALMVSGLLGMVTL